MNPKEIILTFQLLLIIYKYYKAFSQKCTDWSQKLYNTHTCIGESCESFSNMFTILLISVIFVLKSRLDLLFIIKKEIKDKEMLQNFYKANFLLF